MTKVEFQKARVMRASEMALRACQRGDTATQNAWVEQFAVEVRCLNEMEGRK